MDAYLPALMSLVGALIGASLTGWLAFRRLLSEKWWDKKYAAYSETLEALNLIRDDLESSFDAHILNKDIEEERQAELRRAYKTGKSNIEKQRAIGSLVLNDASVLALKEFEKALGSASGAHDYFTHLDESLYAVKIAIDKIVKQGREDLRATRR